MFGIAHEKTGTMAGQFRLARVAPSMSCQRNAWHDWARLFVGCACVDIWAGVYCAKFYFWRLWNLIARRGAVRGLVWYLALCIPLNGGDIASNRPALCGSTSGDT